MAMVHRLIPIKAIKTFDLRLGSHTLDRVADFIIGNKQTGLTGPEVKKFQAVQYSVPPLQ